MSVYVFKLISGDEVITRAESKGLDWNCRNPMVFQLIPDYQTNKHMPVLVPLFMTSKDAECTIKEEHIIASIEAPADVEASYIKATTGLDVPATGKILV